jgi:opacity protein-like surface antigen
MKSKLLVAALFAAGAATSASAADTYSLTINANVIGMCKFTQAAGSVLTLINVAGGIDPSSATNATGAANLTYKCTKGQNPTFATGNGTNWNGTNNRVTNGTDFMVYALAYGATSTGTGFGGGSLTIAVNGTILPAAFAAVSAGLYTDTVPVNVTP